MLKAAMLIRLFVAVFAFGAWADGPDKQSPAELTKARKIIQRDFANVVYPHDIRINRKAVLKEYSYLDPFDEVPKDLLADAVIFFDANKDQFPNQDYITIVDFTPHSNRYRLYIINMFFGNVEKFHTTHGIGSDANDDGLAESFGNVPDTGKSSLGFIRTAEVYSGKFKRSVRLDGLSDTNSNVRDRAIVFHGWDDVHEANVKQGLSWGCITMDWKIKDAAIDKIGEGSLMYIGVAKP